MIITSPALLHVCRLPITGVKIFCNHFFFFLESNIEKPSAWNTWTWQQQQQWNWNWVSSSAPLPTKPPIITPPMLSEQPPSFPMMTPNKPYLPNVSFYDFIYTNYFYLFIIFFSRTIGLGPILMFCLLLNQISGVNLI